MSYLYLIGGLAILLFAADLLVRGAVGLAGRLGVPPLIIGLTVVSFGTSAPELVISVRAALAGAPGIALGNVVGSNIANVLLVLGLPALIASTTCSQPLVLRNTLFMIGASVLFVAMCLTGRLESWHGAVLLALIALFLALSARRARRYRTAVIAGAPVEEVDLGGRPLPVAAGFAFLGIAGLALGAYLTIDGARDIARLWGVSESAIGLTVVALGTSLPELAANVMAAVRRESAIAVGNIIGSNLFNILAVMGVTAVVVSVPVPEQFLRFDLWVMLACALVIVPYVLTRRPIGPVSGALFISTYVVYVVVVFWVLGRTAP